MNDLSLWQAVKFWWQVKRANRKLIKQVKLADKTPYVTTKEDVDSWFENNPFKITREDLCSRKFVVVRERRSINIIKEI